MRLATIILTGILACGPVLAEPAAPDYAVVPLTKADVDFYLDVLRAAAAHNAHLTGDDKAAADATIQMQKGAPKNQTPEQMVRMANLMARAAELASFDDKVAEQRGVSKRYEAVKNEMESVLAQVTDVGGSCGGDCTPPGGFSKAQLDRAKLEENAVHADAPLVKPHVAEIKTLKKQINGFMFGGQ